MPSEETNLTNCLAPAMETRHETTQSRIRGGVRAGALPDTEPRWGTWGPFEALERVSTGSIWGFMTTSAGRLLRIWDPLVAKSVARMGP